MFECNAHKTTGDQHQYHLNITSFFFKKETTIDSDACRSLHTQLTKKKSFSKNEKFNLFIYCIWRMQCPHFLKKESSKRMEIFNPRVFFILMFIWMCKYLCICPVKFNYGKRLRLDGYQQPVNCWTIVGKNPIANEKCVSETMWNCYEKRKILCYLFWKGNCSHS